MCHDHLCCMCLPSASCLVQELKWELLLLLVGTNRGLNVKENERKEIDQAIELLEVGRSGVWGVRRYGLGVDL